MDPAPELETVRVFGSFLAAAIRSAKDLYGLSAGTETVAGAFMTWPRMVKSSGFRSAP
jgi:hypothetical protein